MIPAALQALLTGDAANFIAASTPGGIEAQERAGQIEESFKETLPRDMMCCTQADFVTLGFEFQGDSADPLFLNVKFPKGWRKQATEHAMWSRLLDNKERERGMIFYKAAFYDRKAHVNLVTRYQVKRQEPYDSNTLIVVDAATNTTLQTFKFAKADRFGEQAYKDANAWITAQYPDWKSPAAYWD